MAYLRIFEGLEREAVVVLPADTRVLKNLNGNCIEKITILDLLQPLLKM